MDMNTLLYLKWITNEVLLHSTGNSAQFYVVVWMGGEFGGEWVHVYTWLSPFAIHPNYHNMVGYTSIQNVFGAKDCFHSRGMQFGSLVRGQRSHMTQGQSKK